MPNWTYNTLIIEGDEAVLDKFSKLAKSHIIYSDEEEDTLLDFNKFVPYPKEQIHLDKIRYHSYEMSQMNAFKKKNYIAQKKISNMMLKEIMLFNLEDDKDSWMGWHSINWGTKWNAKYVKIDNVDKNTRMYRFETAWSPPIPVLSAMTKKFPKLTFTMLYGEEGCFFSGFIRVKNNFVMENRQTNYKKNWFYPKTLIRKYKLEKCEEAILGK